MTQTTSDEDYKSCPFCGSGAVSSIMDFKKHIACGNFKCPASAIVCTEKEWETRDA